VIYLEEPNSTNFRVPTIFTVVLSIKSALTNIDILTSFPSMVFEYNIFYVEKIG